MSQLVKVGLPAHLAQGARFSKHLKQLHEEYEAAQARLLANLLDKLKKLVAEQESEVAAAVANSAEEQIA